MDDPVSQYSIAEARDRFTQLVHEAEQGKPVALTRRGEPVAVILSMRAYRRLGHSGYRFWQAVTDFRKTHDLHELDLGPELFDNIREQSPGREVSL